MLSAFEIIGPVMIGPSSSHTAGACRIGFMARALFGKLPEKALIELHGSFATTATGHATDRALVAGLLGFAPHDSRLKDSLQMAVALELDVEFTTVDLGGNKHPNSVRMTLQNASHTLIVEAASIGGGAIRVNGLDGYSVRIEGRRKTLVLWHLDNPSFLSRVKTICSDERMTLGLTQTYRQQGRREALTVLELMGIARLESASRIGAIDGIRTMVSLPILPGY